MATDVKYAVFAFLMIVMVSMTASIAYAEEIVITDGVFKSVVHNKFDSCDDVVKLRASDALTLFHSKGKCHAPVFSFSLDSLPDGNVSDAVFEFGLMASLGSTSQCFIYPLDIHSITDSAFPKSIVDDMFDGNVYANTLCHSIKTNSTYSIPLSAAAVSDLNDAMLSDDASFEFSLVLDGSVISSKSNIRSSLQEPALKLTFDNASSSLDPSLHSSLNSMNDLFGNLFGMPLVFFILVFVASVFTTKNAHIGVIILGFLIGIMVAFDIITISVEIFGVIVVLIVLGMFVGRKTSK